MIPQIIFGIFVTGIDGFGSDLQTAQNQPSKSSAPSLSLSAEEDAYRPTQPGLVRRYHLRSSAEWLPEFGGNHGLGHAQGLEQKTVEQQSLLSLHRARDLLVRQRTQLINGLRGLVAEFGIYIPRGLARAIGFAEDITHGEVLDVPEIANEVVRNLCQQLMALHKRVRWYEERLKQVAKEDERVRLLRTIPGVGVVTASAIIASIRDGHQFRNGREFAAWLGLTPGNKSSGGKEKLGRITKMGDQCLRQLLVVGMTSLVRQTRTHPECASKWLTSLLERKPARVATVAARTVWAILARNEPYNPRMA